jgi:uncharacterized protein DUF4239
MTPRAVTLRNLAMRVLPVMGVSIIGLELVRVLVPADILRQSNDAVGTYLQTVGSIYAVLQAFVVFVVWTQFDQTRTLVEREANDIVDIFRTTQGLPEPHRDEIRARLAAYVDGILEEEWPAMARSDMPTLERASVRLEEAFATLRSFEPATDRDCALFAEALGRFNELYDTRTGRLTYVCARVPFALRMLLYTGGGMTVGATYLLGVDNGIVHGLLSAGLAGAIAHIFYVVRDLDDPFSGDWQVPRGAFERARRCLQARG